MAESVSKSHFPSQALSDIEKASSKFGLDVAKAIEHEWFKRDSSGNRFYINQNSYHIVAYGKVVIIFELLR